MNGDAGKLITIGTLTAADVDGAYHIFETTIPEAYRQEGIESLLDEIQEEIEHKKAIVQSVLQHESDLEPTTTSPFFLIARKEDKVVGTISYGPCGKVVQECTNHRLDHVGTLGSLYVLPELQGQGIASALIAALVTELQKRSITQFCLDSGYRIAQQKWRRKFGEPYVVTKDYWGEGSENMVWLCDVQDFTGK